MIRFRVRNALDPNLHILFLSGGRIQLRILQDLPLGGGEPLTKVQHTLAQLGGSAHAATTCNRSIRVGRYALEKEPWVGSSYWFLRDYSLKKNF